MKKYGCLAVILVVLSLLTGCNERVGAGVILVQENNDLPKNLENKLGKEILAVQKAFNQEEFKEKWNTFNLSKSRPKVDWKNKAVLFLGTEESSSCPNVLEDIEVNAEEDSLFFEFKEYEGPCTADAVVRTFVIELEREVVKDISRVRVDQTVIAID